ncbi:reverse transcriptase domain protein [Colletotrichum truncatum]|uniref:Reverse transcriptase domain protein n=1 Tax=Colletotrichum truncatum TaxID=5467 RepID=A0ACC3YT71_COLTU
MSSRASAKSPTPGSSSSSRNQPQSLAQAMENLNEQLQHAGQAYKKLEEDIKGDANLRKIQELQGEITTLRAAANIVTTPVYGGRQKLKLSAPVTYDGTPGTLKGFLIQVKNY